MKTRAKPKRIAQPPRFADGFTITTDKLATPNKHWHRWAKATITNAQRDHARLGTMAMLNLPNIEKMGYRVRIIWHAGGVRLDNDNLAAGLKWIRDGIAAAYGVDDSDPRWEWEYRQAPKIDGWRGVRVRFMDESFADEMAGKIVDRLMIIYASSATENRPVLMFKENTDITQLATAIAAAKSQIEKDI